MAKLALATLYVKGAPVGTVSPSNSTYPQAYQSPVPQAYQPQPQQQQALSPLEVLQQRFARGEIDAATFQQMRALLEEH